MPRLSWDYYNITLEDKMKIKKNKRVICADGFEMSVQADKLAYCTPRITGAECYVAVEIGFPSRAEPLILRYAEEPGRPTATVYGWVPSEVVSLVIAKHGGIVEGSVPRGVVHIEAQMGNGSV
jgi:hypothetical protein